MTIKDIAQLANVSASTVSKVINGKHDNISEETCERVFKIVKEYNYTPYANSMSANTSKTFLIGVLLRDGIKNSEMIDAILRQARNEGYGVITCISDNNEDEFKNMSMLMAHRVDGILWQQTALYSIKAENEIFQQGIPFFTINQELPSSEKNLCMDLHQAGYIATKALVKAKHQKIACIKTKSGMDVEAFQNGYKQCLYDNGIQSNDTYHLVWGENAAEFDRLLLACTGFVCFNTTIASDFINRAERKNYRIPGDLSVVSLDYGEGYYQEKLSVLKLPYADFGGYCCRTLIAAMENKKAEYSFREPMHVVGASVDVPITTPNKKIVVVGGLNVDTLIRVGCFSKEGEIFAAKSHDVMPGGKGLNQAIGVAKLGAEAYLIGRRGVDFEGNVLINSLLEHNVDVSGVKSDSQFATGRAYIHIQETGESSIAFYEGANKNLSPGDVEEFSEVFENASFCLLQTDIRMDTVICAARLAKERGVNVLLKPTFISELGTELLRDIDILLPNLSDLNQLCPWEGSLEEKARYFLDKGVGTVIVTLSQDGCYLLNSEHSEYFPAAKFQPVDTTGASDAFAAALAVYLANGRDIATAIRYANYAAGLSITRQGVSLALADKNALELYFSNAE